MKNIPTPAMKTSADAMAEEIIAIEQLLNAATARAGALIGAIAQDGAIHGLNIAVGQRLMSSTVGLTEKLNASREAVIEVHRTAAATARMLGVDVTANNPGDKPPEQQSQPLMRAVA